MTDPAAGSSEPDVALAEGMRFDGLLVLPRAARIDGHVGGEVCASGSVEVGAHGVVEARLEASAVIVEGRVMGDVRARDSIVLGPAAVIHGDLAAPRLAMAEGARVNGRCHCGEVPPTRSDSTADASSAAPDPSAAAS
jgi:cytoskeletal protein CcmA (bactofilin family)